MCLCGAGVTALLRGRELRLSLPLHPTLSFASARTWPDLRLQLVGLHVCTTPDRPGCHTGSGGSGSGSRRDTGIYRGIHKVAGVPLLPAGVLLLAYFMFPDQVC